MIQIIAGKKGSGKTKRLIDMTNNAVKTSSGNVVFLDKNDSYMYEVDRAVRFVNVEEYSVSRDGFWNCSRSECVCRALAGDIAVHTNNEIANICCFSRLFILIYIFTYR